MLGTYIFIVLGAFEAWGSILLKIALFADAWYIGGFVLVLLVALGRVISFVGAWCMRRGSLAGRRVCSR